MSDWTEMEDDYDGNEENDAFVGQPCVNCGAAFLIIYKNDDGWDEEVKYCPFCGSTL